MCNRRLAGAVVVSAFLTTTASSLGDVQVGDEIAVTGEVFSNASIFDTFSGVHNFGSVNQCIPSVDSALWNACLTSGPSSQPTYSYQIAVDLTSFCLPSYTSFPFLTLEFNLTGGDPLCSVSGFTVTNPVGTVLILTNQEQNNGVVGVTLDRNVNWAHLFAGIVVFHWNQDCPMACEEQVFGPSPGHPPVSSTVFGRGLALDDDVLVIASSQAFYNYKRIGANWVEQQLVTSPPNGMEFATEVDIDGDYLIVGDPSARIGYIYQRDIFDMWSLAFEVASFQSSLGDAFAVDVDISGETAIIGAWQDDTLGPQTGAAYLFDGPTFNTELKLFAPNAQPGDGFGLSVDIDNNVAVIGAFFGATGPFMNSGAAYIAEGPAWPVQQLTFPEPLINDGDQIGRDVAIEGDLILVGAPATDNGLGAAYIFRRDMLSNWNFEQRIQSTDAGAFGSSVDIDGNQIIIGAPSTDGDAPSSGAAYVYTWNGSQWAQTEKLITVPGAFAGQYGSAVALDNRTAVIGAYAVGSLTGAAYSYDLNCNCAQPFGDVNIDGLVDVADVVLILSNFGHHTTPDQPLAVTDIDADTETGFADMLIVLSNWQP